MSASAASLPSASEFIKAIPEEKRRTDAQALAKLIRQSTRLNARMAGQTLIGFGSYFYHYNSGRQGLSFLTGFSPRKDNLVLYIMPGFTQMAPQMKNLGKYKTGKSCLYIRKLSDVDPEALATLIGDSVQWMKEKYPTGAAATRAATKAGLL